MPDEKEQERLNRLGRLALKWFLYLQLRSGALVKWIYERHPGIAAGDIFLGNQIEKLIKEGNVEAAQKAFDELVKQDQAGYKLKKNFNDE